MAQAAEFCSFQAKIASRGYHIYKNATWVDAREGHEVQVDIETNKESIKVDPYACAIRVKQRLFGAMKTVGHIPREISRHVNVALAIQLSFRHIKLRSFPFVLSNRVSYGVHVRCICVEVFAMDETTFVSTP